MSAILSGDEAASALYIDFEGGQNLPPSFIGIRTRTDERDEFSQIVLEPALYPALGLRAVTHHCWPTGYSRAEALPVVPVPPVRSINTLCGAIEALVRRADAEGRLLVSWSSREQEVAAACPHLSDASKAQFATLWRDAKATAKVWKRKTNPQVQFARAVGRGRHRLANYLAHIGYVVPSHFGDQQAAQRIAAVREQLRTRHNPDQLTPVVKAKWTKVLDYNWHDCNGMREVALRAAIELAGVGRTERPF